MSCLCQPTHYFILNPFLLYTQKNNYLKGSDGALQCAVVCKTSRVERQGCEAQILTSNDVAMCEI